jgi:soluble lytic murein transglycosylase-like protein
VVPQASLLPYAASMKSRVLLLIIVAAIPVNASEHSAHHSDLARAIVRSTAYHSAISASAARYSVDPCLLWTIAYLESRFKSSAVSSKGARGMMQFMPATGRKYGLVGRGDLHDPLRSIEAAARYLRDLNGMFADRIDLVLAGYNAGENAVIRSGYRVPRYRETRQYVASGMSVLRAISHSATFSTKSLESKLIVSTDTASPTNQRVTAPRQPFPSRFRRSRSIYFRIP